MARTGRPKVDHDKRTGTTRGAAKGYASSRLAHIVVCNRCPATTKLEVHHKDRNWRNNAPENLEKLCRDCHIEEHLEELRVGGRAAALKQEFCSCGKPHLARGMCRAHYLRWYRKQQ